MGATGRDWRAWVCVLALLSLPVMPAAYGQQRTFVIGVENLDYLPAYGVQDGEYVGYARALLDAFGADLGIRFEYRPMPVPRLYASLFAGTVDFKYPDNPNWAADARAGRDITYSGPAMTYVDGTLVPAGRELPDAQAIATLGTVTGFTPWAWNDAVSAGQVRVVENADFSALIRQALAGRVDGIYANVAVVRYKLESTGTDPGALEFRPDLPFDRGDYLLSTLEHPEVIAAFDDWMTASSDRVAELQRQYGVQWESDLPH